MNGPLTEQQKVAPENYGGDKSKFQKEYVGQFVRDDSNAFFNFEKMQKMCAEAKEPSLMDEICAYLTDRSFKMNNPLIPSFKEVNQSCEIKRLQGKLIEVQNLAHNALEQNNIVDDAGEILFTEPVGWCPPSKRTKLVETLKQIIELTK